uniref:Uncharacterized protein n=1 Tax=Anguilla anguilla TaxID=7936 RepID=A0A0E9SIQ9_ANGAN
MRSSKLHLGSVWNSTSVTMQTMRQDCH